MSTGKRTRNLTRVSTQSRKASGPPPAGLDRLRVRTVRGTITAQDALSDSDPRVRRAGIKALGRTDGSWAVPTLLEALHDSNERIVLAAVESLGHVGDDTAVAPLVALLRGICAYKTPRVHLFVAGLAITISAVLVAMAIANPARIPVCALGMFLVSFAALLTSTLASGDDKLRRAAANALRRIADRSHSATTRMALRELQLLRGPLMARTPSLDRLYAVTIREIEKNTAGSIALPLPASPQSDHELPIASQPPEPAAEALPRIGKENSSAP